MNDADDTSGIIVRWRDVSPTSRWIAGIAAAAIMVFLLLSLYGFLILTGQVPGIASPLAWGAALIFAGLLGAYVTTMVLAKLAFWMDHCDG